MVAAENGIEELALAEAVVVDLLLQQRTQDGGVGPLGLAEAGGRDGVEAGEEALRCGRLAVHLGKADRRQLTIVGGDPDRACQQRIGAQGFGPKGVLKRAEVLAGASDGWA